MTEEKYAAINGQRAVSVSLRVGSSGPWFAEVDMESDPELTGAVTVEIGKLQLKGTVDATHAGTFGIQTRVRVVGGAGGWGQAIGAKGYHNDGGVKAKTIAEDAAREVGESIGNFVPTYERLGNDYAREEGAASMTLEDVLRGALWWVDYAGVTQAGPRPTSAIDAKDYTVLAYNPRTRSATLSVDDLSKIAIGSVLTDGLDGPQVVREIGVRVTAEDQRVLAWCGGDENSGGVLVDLVRSMVRRASDQALHGVYRYRVVKMAGERVELQAVRAVAGLPDLLPLSMWPGVAGVHAELAAGAEVLVQFVEGDRSQPVVTAFAGKDGVGFQPVGLVIGGPAGALAARLGDGVEVLLPPASFSGTIGGTPATGVLTFPLNKTLGVITGSSGRVKVAT